MGAGASPGADSPDNSLHVDAREALIDAALELFARQGYDATTAEQIAATAGVSPAEFSDYFATPESVLMSIVDDMSHATAAALRKVGTVDYPERALLKASTVMVTAIAEGEGAVPLDRLLAMTQIVNATRNLHRKVSAARRRVIAPVLAERMGVDPKNRRLQHALTMWSAVAASTYAGVPALTEDYEPHADGRLPQRMVASLMQSYGEVMGDDPKKP